MKRTLLAVAAAVIVNLFRRKPKAKSVIHVYEVRPRKDKRGVDLLNYADYLKESGQ